ncbi:hypothetical protein [Streptomyces sp. NRRL WC-3742]|uniref:hypothetical protein n=1 Tax=Streptomyces sp. NRRL WC-3742 TaxID=1463934 RepID=UPI00068EC90F|nr:hypothetical protein [Streptomyces sp. NRRL WC-3742]
MRFLDRVSAGRRLAEAVAPFVGDRSDGQVVVLALAPGGLPVAAEVAEGLGAPLDATVVRQLSVPGHDRPIGAVADGDPPLFDHDSLKGLGLTPIEVGASLKRERALPCASGAAPPSSSRTASPTPSPPARPCARSSPTARAVCSSRPPSATPGSPRSSGVRWTP